MWNVMRVLWLCGRVCAVRSKVPEPVGAWGGVFEKGRRIPWPITMLGVRKKIRKF
jgi:hypothetical protein